ncbi:hypothetical protein ACYEXS_16215 [Paenibacillus sp. MAH-36]|uniref:Tail tape measure protein n=1 Tax=Paenibacillus violae TaxID=3077234 RepID=A0ABU3RHS5_9BACL|nr:hypothetical protein [Paenibacillus sp. PFR10]MDU0203824.1 hypothetical protein [Paenibacillus sp. PFR10]
MSEIVTVNNLERVMAAQERLRSLVERTGASAQKLTGLFNKAAEAGTKLSQITARPAIAGRDYFSFVIDRMLLQLADLGHTKVDVKLMINDQIIRTAKQLRELLQGLGGEFSGSLEGKAKASASASATAAVIIAAPPEKGQLDKWLDRLLIMAEIVKLLGEAFEAFGNGFKSFAQGLKILKGLFAGNGGKKEKCKDPCKDNGGKRTKSDADSKTRSKSGAKTKNKTGARSKNKAGARTKTRAGDRTNTIPGGRNKSRVRTRTGGQDRGRQIVQGDREGHPAEPRTSNRLGKFSRASKLLRTTGKVLKPLGIGLSALDILTSDNKVGAAIQAGAGVAGAALGAFAGSIVPGAGTAVGGIIGGWLGDKAGELIVNKWFSGKEKEPPKEARTELLPAGRETVLMSASAASVGVSEGVNSNQYNISVDGITVNMPKEKVDMEELAVTIGHQIVMQIGAAIQNRAENGGRAYGY